MAQPPLDPTVDALIDRFIEADEDRRLELLEELRALSADQRPLAKARVLRELETRFSARADFSAPSPGTVANTRGWLLSGLRATSDGDELLHILSDYVTKDPAEWVRYWALANIFWISPERAQRVSGPLDDSSDLVRTLGQVIQATAGRSGASLIHPRVEDIGLLGQLHEWRSSPRSAWIALRALQIVSVPSLTGSIARVLRELTAFDEPLDDERYALAWDCVMALAKSGEGGTWLKGFTPADLARVIMLATRGARPGQIRRVAAVLRDAIEGNVSLRTALGHALTRDPTLAPPARAILIELGLIVSLALPSGPDRLELAYYLVVQNPSRFKVLETFSPQDIREMAAGLLGDTPPDSNAAASLLASLRQSGQAPDTLWRAWVETTQAAKLTQD